MRIEKKELFLKRFDIIPIIITWSLFFVAIFWEILLLKGFYTSINCNLYNTAEVCGVGHLLGGISNVVYVILTTIIVLPCLIMSWWMYIIRISNKDLSVTPYLISMIGSIIIFVTPFIGMVIETKF